MKPVLLLVLPEQLWGCPPVAFLSEVGEEAPVPPASALPRAEVATLSSLASLEGNAPPVPLSRGSTDGCGPLG